MFIPGGYVMLSRTLIESEVWFCNPKVLKVAMYLLIVANHSPKKVGHIQVGRGQTYRRLARIAEECELSIKMVRTALDHLTSIGFVTKERCEGARSGQRITICNYDTYQDASSYEGHTTGHSVDPKKARNKNDNNVKNEKKQTAATKKPPALVDVEEYFTSKGSTASEASIFHDHFSLAGWHDSQGKKIRVWKQNAAGWIRRNAPKKLTKEQQVEAIKKKPRPWSDDEFMLVSRYEGSKWGNQ